MDGTGNDLIEWGNSEEKLFSLITGSQLQVFRHEYISWSKCRKQESKKKPLQRIAEDQNLLTSLDRQAGRYAYAHMSVHTYMPLEETGSPFPIKLGKMEKKVT